LTVLLINIGCTVKVQEAYPKDYESAENLDIELNGNYSFFQSGTASWYGKKFHGRPTASGTIFNMYKISAAHKTIPLGTYILVVNKSNGKKIKVIVNDRGPFIPGRVLDLSYAAAKKLGYADLGLTEVDIFVFGNVSEKCLSLQLGAFQSEVRAKNFSTKLQKETSQKIYISKEGDYYKVLCGKFSSRKSAELFKEKNKYKFSGFIVSCK